MFVPADGSAPSIDGEILRNVWSGPHTVVFAACPHPDGSGIDRRVFSHGDPQEAGFCARLSDTTLQGVWSSQGSSRAVPYLDHDPSGEWFLGIVDREENHVEFRFNGHPAASGLDLEPATPDAPIYFGGGPTPGSSFHGSLAYVAVYGRKLSSDELALLEASWFGIYAQDRAVIFGRNCPAYVESDDGSCLYRVGPNAPRVSLRGLLIEGPATNLLLHSRDLTRPTWNKTGCTITRGIVGPDGLPRACSVLADAANAEVNQLVTDATTNRHTGSIYLRRIAGAGMVEVGANGQWIPVTLTPEWRRFALFAEGENYRLRVRISTPGDEIGVDFGQVEAGSFVSSPIVTGDAPESRLADDASMPALAFPEAAHIQVQADITPLWHANPENGVCVFDSSTPETANWVFRVNPMGGLAIEAGESFVVFGPDRNWILGKPRRVGFATRGTSMGTSVDGMPRSWAHAESLDLPAPENVTLGHRTGGFEYLNGYIRNLTVESPASAPSYHNFIPIPPPPADVGLSTPAATALQAGVGEEAQAEVLIGNASRTAAVIEDISVEGGGFALASPMSAPLVVEPGERKSVGVRFSPTNLNQKTATLTVSARNAAKRTVNAELAGMPTFKLPLRENLTANDGRACSFVRPGPASYENEDGETVEVGENEPRIRADRGVLIGENEKLSVSTEGWPLYKGTIQMQVLATWETIPEAPILDTRENGNGFSLSISASGAALGVWRDGSVANVLLAGPFIWNDAAHPIRIEWQGDRARLGVANGSTWKWSEWTDAPAPLAHAQMASVGSSGTTWAEAWLADLEITSEPTPRIALDPESHDFGTLEKGTNTSILAKIENRGDRNLVVSHIDLDGDAYSVDSIPSLPLVLPPGGSAEQEVWFGPKQNGLEEKGFLLIRSNDPAKPIASLAMTGKAPFYMLLPLREDLVASDGRVCTFSRPSKAWYEAADGTIREVAEGQPRLRADRGVLIEEARTNRLVWSRDLTRGAWEKVRCTVERIADATALGGYVNRVTISASEATGAVRQLPSSLSTAIRTSRVRVRKVFGSGLVQTWDPNADVWKSNIEIGTEWTWLTVTGASASASGGCGVLGYQGDVFDVDWCQVEDGSFPTSPIWTEGTALARAADVLSVSTEGWPVGAGRIALRFSSIANATGSDRYLFDAADSVNGVDGFIVGAGAAANRVAVAIRLSGTSTYATSPDSQEWGIGERLEWLWTGDLCRVWRGDVMGMVAVAAPAAIRATAMLGHSGGVLQANGWLADLEVSHV